MSCRSDVRATPPLQGHASPLGPHTMATPSFPAAPRLASLPLPTPRSITVLPPREHAQPFNLCADLVHVLL